jgi:ParB-like nuclease family protein
MSDIDSALNSLHDDESTSISPVREGLPPRYRMRADAHYVEQLESTRYNNTSVRYVDVQSIDNPRQDDGPGLSSSFVDSIKRHGIIQPLLVRSRGGRHVVVAGRKRLAAAVAAGLREVPCLVERVDDEDAQALASASNVPAIELPAPRPAPLPVTATDFPIGAFAECLTAVAASASLLSPGTTLTQAVAVDLVRAEAARALQVLLVMRVLRGETALARRPLSVRMLLERIVERSAAERRLRGMTLSIEVHPNTPVTAWGDEELLLSAAAALVMSTAVLLEAPHGSAVTLRAAARGEDSCVVSATHLAELPHQWRSKLAEDPREPGIGVKDSSTPAFVMLRGARRIAELHGGEMTLDCTDGMTSVSLTFAIGRS